MSKKYRRLKGNLSRRSRRSGSWRGLSSQFKLKKLFNRIKLVVFLVLGVSLVWGAIYLWNFFTKPFASAASSFQNTQTWDGRSPFNLLFIEVSDAKELAPLTSDMGVLAFNPTQDSFTVINLPVAHEKLHNSYALGRLSAKRDGLKAVKDKVSGLLGITVDGYVLVGEGGLKDIAALFPGASEVKDYVNLSTALQIPSVWRAARDGVQTDLDIPEILRIFWYLLTVRSDKVATLSVSSQLLDDVASLDKKIAPFVRDENLVAEHLKIQVLNGSGIPGVAANAARIVSNLGGDVIRMDNFERHDLVKGFLITESSGSYTAARLASIFGLADSRPPRSGAEARANITVVLGVDNSY